MHFLNLSMHYRSRKLEMVAHDFKHYVASGIKSENRLVVWIHEAYLVIDIRQRGITWGQT
jgi:hypothetical protein